MQGGRAVPKTNARTEEVKIRGGRRGRSLGLTDLTLSGARNARAPGNVPLVLGRGEEEWTPPSPALRLAGGLFQGAVQRNGNAVLKMHKQKVSFGFALNGRP